MPTRFIKESCRSSKNLDKLSDFEERLFWRLITTADDFGRFMACPELVKASCFPYKTLAPQKIKDALLSLQTHNLITLYVGADREYGFFNMWELHQGKPRAKTSKYPDPTDTQLNHMLASANICMQPLAHVTGHSNTDTDTNTDLSSLSSLKSEEGKESEKGEFEQFWQAYPRKVGKKAAQKAFQNARDRPRIDDLLLSISRQRASPQWAKEGGQFIPHPATWLNRGQWSDVPPETKPSVFEEFLARGEGHDEIEG